MEDHRTLSNFDETVAEIYEAAIDPSVWDVALMGLISRFAPPRWEIAMLVWERLDPPDCRFLGAAGVNEFAREGYRQFYTGRQPWSRQGHAIAVGAIAHSDQIVDRQSFKGSDFYRQFLSTWDLEVAILATLERQHRDHLALCLPGPDTGDIDPLFAITRRLLPHIQRSSRISQRIGEADLRRAEAETALDLAPSAVFSLDSTLGIRHCNQRAEAFAAAGYAQVRQKNLILADAKAHAALRRFASRQEDGPSLALEIAPEGQLPMRALAMRMRPQLSQSLASALQGSDILLVVNSNDEANEVRINRYVQWFGLTPSEARLAVQLARGDTLEEYANSRGVSVNAARFLLKGLFAKTQTNKQSTLVAKLHNTPVGWG